MSLSESQPKRESTVEKGLGISSWAKRKAGLVFGFGAMLLLMLLLTIIGLLGMGSIESRLEKIVNNHMEKIKLVEKMHNSARERTLILHRMIIESDPFKRDEEFMKYNRHALDFTVARTKLLTFRLTVEEVKLINEQSRFTRMVVPIQDNVVDLMADDKMDEARTILIEGATPLQNRVLEQLFLLKTYQEMAAASAGIKARSEYIYTRNWVITLSVMMVITGVSIAFFVISNLGRFIREREQHLDHLERTRAALEISSNNLIMAKAQENVANNAKNQFLANMSHELRTPLNAIIGYSELLKDELIDAGQEKYSEDCQKIQSAAKYLSRIISEILDLSKIESGIVKPRFVYFDLNALIEEVSVIISPLANKNGNVYSVNLDPSLGLIYSDAIKIRQILFNILNNACKFTKNGQIKILAYREMIDGNDWCTIDVEDTGIGIAQKELENIFKPFVQADGSPTREFAGTGLGLAIANNLCKIIGGKIKVKTIVGKGSVFQIKFPVVAMQTQSKTTKITNDNVFSIK